MAVETKILTDAEIKALEFASKLAETITLDQVPLILVQAMAGNTIEVPGIPPEMITDKSPNVPDSPVKGLILSKEHIIQIKKYVSYGLQLPTEIKAVTDYLAYSSETYPEIGPTAFSKLFGEIHDHCSKWSGLESRIKTLGTDLNIFGNKFVIVGQDVVDIIDEMPAIVKAKTTVGTSDISVPFSKDDTELRYCLLELLDELKKEVVKRLDITQNLLQTLEAYRETMDNKIIPSSAKKESELVKLNLSTKIAQLLNEVTELQNEVDQLDTQYKTMVGLAFTGVAGMILPIPTGVITWAITGGVFGGLAESVRKDRNDKQDELNTKQQELEDAEAFTSAVTAMRTKVTDMNYIINDAAIGIRNLETLWQSVYQHIENSKSELEEITESTRLALFSVKMKSSVKSWSEVKDITGELVTLFEKAQREAAAL